MNTKDVNTMNRNELLEKLGPKLSGTVKIDKLTLAMYSTDASIYRIEPLAVVMPKNQDDIVQVVRFARENKLTIIPRGGGSGLAGEAIGRGLVIDFSCYMNEIVDIDIEHNQVTVQPGVVLEQLNRKLRPLGKQVGPDPASGNRATIGGMIGNNSTGAHSLVYGYLGQYIKSLTVVAADGQVLELDRSHRPDCTDGVLSTQWAATIHSLVKDHRSILEKTRPTCERNGSGYNLYAALQEDGTINLAELLAGSEGTLAIVTQATIGLVDQPKVKGLLQVNFNTLSEMARAVPHILKANPSACELMDGTLLGMARAAYPKFHDVLPTGIDASLLVEFTGEDRDELEVKINAAAELVDELPDDARSVSKHPILDSELQSRVMAARKAAVPLLYRNKSATQPIPVIEDTAVDASQLDKYIEGLQAISKRLDVPMAYYAHAGHGELHIRPFLNLHKVEDLKRLKQLADEVFELVWSLGGTISGEHGEGLVRAAYIKRQYGEEMYELFRQVKDVFDPEGTLNPGKIINDDPDIMLKDLRFAEETVRRDYQSALNFGDDELEREIEQCNGNGLCRSLDPTLSMCPTFRATGQEEASPRAKANLMRHWLYGQLDADIMQTDEFKAIADLCINCKSCALQCPSLVNIPKLMAEARAQYVRKHGLTRTQWLLSHSEAMSKVGATFGGLANFFLRQSWFRSMMQAVTGLDARRPMPAFGTGANIPKLRQYLNSLPPLENPTGRVAYFVDLYANYNDHQLGRAVVDVLRHNNIEVIIPDQVGVSMPALSYGKLDIARQAAEYNIYNLAQAVEKGYTIVCSEPTAALCLKEEYLDLIDSDEAKRVADNTYELTEYLVKLAGDNAFNIEFNTTRLDVAYHMPCHYRAMEIDKGTVWLLSQIDGVNLRTLPNSCCGIAGTFGFQKKNFDLSVEAGKPMLDAFKESVAPIGLTECGTCKMQMELIGQKPVLHPIKVLAKAYGLQGYETLTKGV